jgi:hypothetical protein
VSRIGNHQHAERLTREAAKAVGRQLDHWVWCAKTGGLINGDPQYPDKFAPLRDPGDAYEIESALQIDVKYQPNGPASTVMQMSQRDTQGAMFEVLGHDREYNLRKRMELAVIMASLHLLINGAVQKESDHGLAG